MIIIAFITGILSGVLGVGVFLYLRLQSLMLRETRSRLNFEESIKVFTEAVDSRQWKLLGEYDLQAKMKANGFDVLEAKVFDICKPAYASQILAKDAERIVSPLMPCRVAIYKKSDGYTYFSRMNSELMSKPMKGVVPVVMGKAAKDVEDILNPLRS